MYSLEAILQLHPKCPAILVNHILQVFARTGISIFLIYKIIDDGQTVPILSRFAG